MKDVINLLIELKSDVSQTESKIDFIQKEMSQMKETLQENHQVLVEHKKRADSHEKQMELQLDPMYQEFIRKKHEEEFLQKQKKDKEERLKSLKSKMVIPGILVGCIVGIGSLVSYLSGFFQFLEKMMGGLN